MNFKRIKLKLDELVKNQVTPAKLVLDPIGERASIAICNYWIPAGVYPADSRFRGNDTRCGNDG